MTESDVICFKCKVPLRVIELEQYEEEDESYLEDRELSKGKCPKCGREAYFTVEWLFTIRLSGGNKPR